MPTLTDGLAAQLQGGPTSQLAQQLGISQEQSSAAISAALPLIMGALGRNASEPQGAQALFGALQNDHAGLDIGSALGAVLGGSTDRQADGAGILGHIFGGKQARAEAGVARTTGLGQGQAGQLLKLLAPIVMAYLARQMMSGGAGRQGGGAEALGGLLGREHQQIRKQGGLAGGLLGAVLDRDGDGQLGLDDLAELGGLFGKK
jgi:hypothetical protein